MPTPNFAVHLATDLADLHAAQRLRYQVFVAELGAAGPMVDHVGRRECDGFDAHAQQLILRDKNRALEDQIIGVYRLMTRANAAAAGQFYCADEYDLQPLLDTGKPLLELGRSCLHADYRGGIAMMHLWSALAAYVQNQEIAFLFGVASFHGTDVAAIAEPLSLLHDRYLAPEHLRVKARAPGAQPMNLRPIDQIDRVAAMRDTPALIKAYLRLGGKVGADAFVDHGFNTVDVCLILPVADVDPKQLRLAMRD